MRSRVPPSRIAPRITAITLGVRDVERALRFYRDGLGWLPSGYFADPDGHPWEVAWAPGIPLRRGRLMLPS